MAFNSTPKILVADDDALYRMIFEEALDKLGCAYKIVNGGSQAIMELIAAPNAFSCVVLDVFMDRLDGIETGHIIRRLNLDVPIIMITGDHRQETEDKARCVGIIDFLRKPITHEQIMESVSRALRAMPALGLAAGA